METGVGIKLVACLHSAPAVLGPEHRGGTGDRRGRQLGLLQTREMSHRNGSQEDGKPYEQRVSSERGNGISRGEWAVLVRWSTERISRGVMGPTASQRLLSGSVCLVW